ncbi:MAG: DHH family phosphoesterase, partial [Pseudomonadota bacterium]
MPADTSDHRRVLVANSFSGRRWLDAASDGAERAGLAIAQRHGVPASVARLLAIRGVTDSEVEDYLDPTLKRLMPDPSTLQGMDAAAERLADAIRNQEPVAIFGDYDVDGAASSALLARFLRHFELAPQVHIPDRITEGYGPNSDAIDALAEKGATLLVTVDCGTSGHGPLAHAKARGLDVIVLDHHQTDGDLPDVLSLVNPNRPDCASGQGHLCAAGVVFLTLVAVARLLRAQPATVAPPQLLEWLDLVALATVCDVVPLKSLNRAFVVKGLAVMGKRINPGLAALQDVGRVTGPLTPYHLGFILGPRINAGGRIGRAELGSLLLATDDPAKALRYAGELDLLNAERQAMEAEMLKAAFAQAESQVATDPDAAALVIADPGWHSGLVGLLASRVKDRFRRPVIAVA